jgi:hypothetical protein
MGRRDCDASVERRNAACQFGISGKKQTGFGNFSSSGPLDTPATGGNNFAAPGEPPGQWTRNQ